MWGGEGLLSFQEASGHSVIIDALNALYLGLCFPSDLRSLLSESSERDRLLGRSALCLSTFKCLIPVHRFLFFFLLCFHSLPLVTLIVLVIFVCGSFALKIAPYCLSYQGSPLAIKGNRLWSLEQGSLFSFGGYDFPNTTP